MKTLSVVGLCVVAQVGLLSCAIPRPERTEIRWDLVSRICQNKLSAESAVGSGEILILSQTTPTLSYHALRLLEPAPPLRGLAEINEIDLLEAATRDSFVSLPIQVVQGAVSCRARSVRSFTPSAQNSLCLELSSPLVNPFVPSETGLFARFSLGGAPGASWYWVRLKFVRQSWVFRELVQLDIDDG
jgi:hypothetical protein